MSVAFRRESDEEHKEPRFELPIPVGPNLVTANGFALIEARVAALEEELAGVPEPLRREEAARELRYWRTRRATAELAPSPPENEVALGSRVHFQLGGSERTISIVGHDEADPARGRIAFSAPLARALIGAEVGDLVDFGGKAGAIAVTGVSPLEQD